MDKIRVIDCKGGLNEDMSDIDAPAGCVRRASNYEQVAEGGYRQIGGSVKWSGVDNSIDVASLTIVEVSKHLFIDPLETFFPNYPSSRITLQDELEYRYLFAVGREDSQLIVAQKVQPTTYFRPGDQINASATIITENPQITEEEEDLIVAEVAIFGINAAEKPIGSGEIHLLTYAENDNLLCVRRDGAEVVFQHTYRDSFAGSWIEKGRLTVPDGGRWESVRYKFPSLKEKEFIVTGTSKPIMYDPLFLPNIVELTVADITQNPTHVIVHQNHLFLSYPGGVVVHSDINDPESFTGVGGAAEFNVGAEVTGFQILPGKSLAIFCDDKIEVLSGTSTADWVLSTHSTQVGAIPGSIQNLPTTIFCSRRGISTLAASDNYGDFSERTLSQKFDQSYRAMYQNTALYSAVNRKKSQYRVINENGRGFYLTFSANSLVGAMPIDLKQDITALGTIEGDLDRLFYATKDGWVHMLDVGSTLSGLSLESFLELPSHHYGSPRQKKRFKQVVIDVKGDPATVLKLTNTVEKGHSYHQPPEAVSCDNLVADKQRFRANQLSRFDQRFQSIAYTAGTGYDQSILVEPVNLTLHEIESITVHFTYRGQKH